MAFAPAGPIALGAAAAATAVASEPAGQPPAPVRIDARLEPPSDREPLERLEPAQAAVAGALAGPTGAQRPAPIVTDSLGDDPVALVDPGGGDVAPAVASPEPRGPFPGAAPGPDPGTAANAGTAPERIPAADRIALADPVPAPDRFAQAMTVGADFPADARSGCTAAQLRRFIKSRAYVPLHELRRRFELYGDEDDVSPIQLGDRRLFVGLPDREARLLGELLEAGDVGYELLLDPTSPLVVGVFPMRPVPRS